MDNENFKIRAYGLQELGIQYFPNSAPAGLDPAKEMD